MKDTSKCSKLLEVSSLSKKFSSNWVLKDISLNIEKGDFILLRGENGSGKTTLLKTIAGIHPPDRGEVSFIDTNKKVRESQARVTFLGSKSYLYSRLTVLENLELYCDILKSSIEANNKDNTFKDTLDVKLKSLINSLKLEKYLGTVLENASSGTRKKTALLRTLLIPSELLVLDEPFVYLDKAGKDSLSFELSKLNEEGKTLLIASNQEKEFWKSSTLKPKILGIREGRLVG